MDRVINWYLLLIIFVFDPLAITLVVVANQAFDRIRPKKEQLITEPILEVADPIIVDSPIIDDYEDTSAQWYDYPDTAPIVDRNESDTVITDMPVTSSVQVEDPVQDKQDIYQEKPQPRRSKAYWT